VNNLTLAIIGLRASALALLLSGNTVAANRMYALADLVEAGRATDEQMRLVAEILKNGGPTDADWDALMTSIEAGHAALQR
jgi:hypothetical protein